MSKDVGIPEGSEGFHSYYTQKISELQFTVNERQKNLLRLQAQRNELNLKGKVLRMNISFIRLSCLIHSSLAARGAAVAPGAGELYCGGCEAHGQE